MNISNEQMVQLFSKESNQRTFVRPSTQRNKKSDQKSTILPGSSKQLYWPLIRTKQFSCVF